MASLPSQSSSSTAPMLPHYDPHDLTTHRSYYYPPIHRPPPAHVAHVKRLSETHRMETSRIQSSISSAGSASSAGLKQCPSPQTYRHASNAEQGLLDEKARASWANSIHKSGSHSPPRQEMVENNSAVLRYIHEQQRIEEEEEKDDDHAIWVLVRSFVLVQSNILLNFDLVLAFMSRSNTFIDQRDIYPTCRPHIDVSVPDQDMQVTVVIRRPDYTHISPSLPKSPGYAVRTFC